MTCKLNWLIRKEDTKSLMQIEANKQLKTELLDAIKVQNQELKNSLNFYQTQLTSKDKRVDAAIRSLVKKEEILSMEKTVADCVAKLKDLKNSFEDLRKSVSSNSKDIQDLNKVVDDLKIDILTQKKSHFKEFSDGVENLSTKVSELQSLFKEVSDNFQLQKSESSLGTSSLMTTVFAAKLDQLYTMFEPLYKCLNVPMPSSSAQGGEELSKGSFNDLINTESRKSLLNLVSSFKDTVSDAHRIEQEKLNKQKQDVQKKVMAHAVEGLFKKKIISGSDATDSETQKKAMIDEDLKKKQIAFEQRKKLKTDDIMDEKKKAEKEEQYKVERSLRKQIGSSDASTELKLVKKVWDEATIRAIAYCDRPQYSLAPFKGKYDEPLTDKDQLDMVFIPSLLTVKVFVHDKCVKISNTTYESLMIKYYAEESRDQDLIWTTKRIKKIVRLTDLQPYKSMFSNCCFVVKRDSEEEETISLADLPFINPADIFILLKFFLVPHQKKEKNYSQLLKHLRMLLAHYYQTLGVQDGVIGKLVEVEPKKPDLFKQGISKCQDGQVLRDGSRDIGVVFTSSNTSTRHKKQKMFMHVDDLGCFSTNQLRVTIDRVEACFVNSPKDKKDMIDSIQWVIKHRSFLEDNHEYVFEKE